MRRLICSILLGCLVPLAAPVVASRQAAAPVQKPPAADAQAPVTSEQVRSAIDRLGDLDFPIRSSAARTVEARRCRDGRAGAARRGQAARRPATSGFARS